MTENPIEKPTGSVLVAMASTPRAAIAAAVYSLSLVVGASLHFVVIVQVVRTAS